MRTDLKLFLMVLIFSTAQLFDSIQQSHGAERNETQDAGSFYSYGTLYVLEQNQRPALDWRFGLGYGVELNHPYLNVQGGSFSLEYSIFSYLRVGGQFSRYFSSPSHFLQALDSQMDRNGFKKSTESIHHSFSSYFTVVPLRGQMTLFGTHSTDLELGIRGGVSRLSYEPTNDVSYAVSWSVRPAIYVESHLFLFLALGQELESPFHRDERLWHFRLDSGIGWAI